MTSARLVDSGITKLAGLVGGVGSLSDPISAADLEDAVDFTCAVVKGYTLGPTDSNTIDTEGVCDTSPVIELTRSNYEGSFTLFRESDSSETAVTSAYVRGRNLFSARGVRLDIIQRIDPDKGADDAFAAGDEVDIFGFLLDHPKDIGGQEGDAYAITEVRLVPQGRMRLRLALSA